MGTRSGWAGLRAGAVAVALVVAACSGDDTDTTAPATAAPVTTEPAPDTRPPDTVPDTTPPDTTPPDTTPDTSGPDPFPEPVPVFDARPVVFVHGSSGSGAQFQAQAMRFASNGYPIDRLAVVDYNSGAVAEADVPSALDTLIDELTAASGHDQVDLIGHSLGTVVSNGYLMSDPARAARVVYYVNVDGGAWDAPPGGVPTMALWGEAGFGRRTADDEIPGAVNVHFPDQAHVEVATSPEAFAEMFRFFNDGRDPVTVDIVPQRSDDLTLAGRAVNFPQNEGVDGAVLDIWQVDPATGQRLRSEPDASFDLVDDGSWGPFDGEHGASYEMVISRGPDERQHHFYLPPLVRSDHLVRLNTSPPGGGIAALLQTSDDSFNLVVSRYREWWGDEGAGSDVLEVDGTDVINAATAPRRSNVIGVLIFDADTDGVTNLDEPIAALFAIGFLTGIDLAAPAADPPDRTITVRMVPRGDISGEVIINVPNWASTGHAVSLHFLE